MSTSVVLPALGESVTEGTVTRWLKKVGDTVQADEGLLEISTDKVDTEIPSPVSGVIEEILVQEDETVEVGAVLAKIGEGGSAPAADATPTDAEQPAEAPAEAPARRGPGRAPPRPSPRRPRPADAGCGSSARRGAAAPPRRASEAPAAADPAAGKDVVLPELGESVTEGTVTRWLKKVGDSVEVDEALLEISTDKVDTEIPSPFAGVLQEILVQEDETVAVGSPLARIGDGAAAPAGRGSGAGRLRRPRLPRKLPHRPLKLRAPAAPRLRLRAPQPAAAPLRPRLPRLRRSSRRGRQPPRPAVTAPVGR